MNRHPLHILSIETTCDETGAAVLSFDETSDRGVPRIASCVVASQFELHRRFGGVVPEIAARAHLTSILPVIDEALRLVDMRLDQIGAVAVATRPGLVGSLLVGLSTAKALALACEIPLVEYDHLEGHLFACQLAHPEVDVYPCVGLVVSGGHTHLYKCSDPLVAQVLGGTIDDAAGEAFDKAASLLGLGFPGGPAIEQAAQSGNSRAFSFPRAFLRDDRLEFSFSGLKTAVLYAVRDMAGTDASQELPAELVSNLAASFQAAVVDVLVAKCRQAARSTGLRRLCVGGGVVANRLFRDRLMALRGSDSIEVFIPPQSLCTDNAALGGIAFAKLAAGKTASLDIDVQAGLLRIRQGVD